MPQVIVLAFAAAAIAAAPASASRAPTAGEKAAIRSVVLGELHVPAATSCVQAKISVSTVAPGWAYATPFSPASCSVQLGNGSFFLQKEGGRWVIRFTGSDAPECWQVSASITRDLAGFGCVAAAPADEIETYLAVYAPGIYYHQLANPYLALSSGILTVSTKLPVALASRPAGRKICAAVERGIARIGTHAVALVLVEGRYGRGKPTQPGPVLARSDRQGRCS